MSQAQVQPELAPSEVRVGVDDAATLVILLKLDDEVVAAVHGEYRRLALASTTHEPLEYPDPSACCPNSPLSVRGGGEIYTYTYSCSLLTASKCPLGATDQWTEASNLLAQLASAGACTFAMYAPLDHTARHTYTCIP